jgi:type II secretory ATPase GspE/PulE/Tfp pilus assembly ATPase PilB-like protein
MAVPPTSTLEQELAKGANISIINVVNALIERADTMHASDIHIDPSVSGVRVRLRIDGVLQELSIMPKQIHGEIVSRIKVMSGLRTDEHQSTQDGRFRYQFASEKGFVDVRVSIIPTYHGENCVMRLLSDKAENYTLEMLGFSAPDREKILAAVKKPHGMILSTGPTGSGKTTTLYTLIKVLNSKDVSIVTIEDPIEYAVADIEQIQVNARTGLTFATGLRSILRQDPNIIMVGEIRDSETAGIAVNTALTGHLLLSTLHTNDAATTLPRLLDMKIEPYLVASTVNIAIGQRLVRKVCTHCAVDVPLASALRDDLQKMTSNKQPLWITEYKKGVGCKECNLSGYSGRITISEVLVADEEIREAILKKASSDEIRRIAVKNGMTTMFDDGMQKVSNGITTIEEILRVIHA